jgi:hypothetical protein
MSRVCGRGLAVAVTLAALAVGGCKFDFGTAGADPEGTVSRVPTGPGIGSMCTRDAECRDGLVCGAETRTCAPAANKIPGARCLLSAECLSGNYCTPFGTCAPSGAAAEGASCSSEGDCQAGLTCAVAGLYGVCAKAGAGDLNAACTGNGDCAGGLICYQAKCTPFWGIQQWTGASCSTDEEPVSKVYFKVPRQGEPVGNDFFRLPFPNDIRMKGGKLSLAGFPAPGPRFLPVDPVDLYVKALERDSTGFGTNGAVFFRFSRSVDLATYHAENAISLVNVTKDSPEYNLRFGHGWTATDGRGMYICPRYLVVRPPRPLLSGTTYAVILRRSILDKEGRPFQADEDFQAMLAAAAPADADLAAAWTAYAPLRAWIADQNLDPTDIVAAAVFTTERHADQMTKLRAAVRAAGSVAVKQLVRCGGGEASPCAGGQGEDRRGCPASPNAAFDEYQGLVSVPIFQEGAPPYELTGGRIVTDAAGTPAVQRTEDVCVALTVPKGTPPAGGWPVVLYAHGTGGVYRSFVRSGLAAEFARGEAAGGAAVPMAMLGYDGILHGPRKGASAKPSSELVFNYLNPVAARDNAVQGAADIFALVRALESWNAGGVVLDKAKLGFYGHSQGGNAGALAMGYEAAVGPVILSGTGGMLKVSLLEKKNPVSVAAALPIVLSDPRVDGNHPVLNLLQMYFDRSDPVNHARRISVEPPMGVKPKSFLHIFGKDDTYSPDLTQKLFAQAAAIPVVNPVVSEHGLAVTMAPVHGNYDGPDGKITVVQTQYAPSGYDGHFVSTEHPAARRTLVQMMGTVFRDGTPTVTP